VRYTRAKARGPLRPRPFSTAPRIPSRDSDATDEWTGHFGRRVQWRFRPDGRGRGSGLHDFDEYAQIKHVMVELSGEAEQGWHYTIFGDPKAD